MTNLTGKRALITGGTSGIGLATAKQFLRAGATIAITGNNPGRLEAAQAELGDDVVAIRANAAEIAATRRAVEQAAERMGGLDILYLNAGVYKPAPLNQVDEALYNESFDVNVKSVLFTVQAAAPLMSDGGSIVVTTSVMKGMGIAGASVYAASKAAAASLVRSLAGELAARNIRVNAVSPGPVETPLYGKLGMSNEDLEAVAKYIVPKIPLARFGKDDEIARAALFLASDAASFITGTEIVADGGWTGVMP